MKRLGLYSLLLFLSLTGFSQTQLSRGGFGNGTVLNGSSASYQLKSSVNGIGFRVQGVQATGVIAGDSLSLVALYNATGGNMWTDTTNWLTGNVATWAGITVTGDRVTAINLPVNNLTGDLPAQLGDLTALDTLNLDANQLVNAPPEMATLTSLTYLDLGRNQLESFPDLSALTSLQSVQLSYGFLDFNDILPNVFLTGIFFGPQNIKNSGYDSIMTLGGNITIDLTGAVPGTGNVYQWQKDGVDIPGATNEIMSIANFSANDNGTYVLSVTNPSDNGLGVNILSYNYNLNMLGTMYWIGDGGDWKDMAHWSYTSGTVDPVVALPGSFDDVRFDSLSFSLSGQIVTILDDTTTVGVEVRSMDWTGVTNAPTFQVKTTVSDWIYSRVFGSMIFDQNMQLDFRGAEFYFAPETNYVLDTKGLYLGDDCWLAINYGWGAMPGANVTCDVLSDINPAGLYLNKGLLNLNGNSVTEKDSYVWVRGDSTTLNATGSYLDVSNLILNSTTVGATLIADSSTFKVSTSLRTSGVMFNKVILSDTAKLQLYSNTYNVLEIAPGSNVVFDSEITQNVGSFIANGTSTMPISISASKLDTAAVLNVASGEVSVNYVTFKDNTATGGALFNAYNSLDSGNVTGWNFISNQVLFTQDSLALVALYNTTSGASWTNSTNWLVGTPDTWFGVTVTDSRVTGIQLGLNNLAGNLPLELGNLTQLGSLELPENTLSDSIPNEIWLMPNLSTVNLHTNQIQGNLPSNFLADSKLTFIELSNNQLVGEIPLELGTLQFLESLSIQGNQLTGLIPSELGNLNALNWLSLADNMLEGEVPENFTSLSNLTDLFIYNNNITSLPDLSILPSLSTLVVFDNYLNFDDLESNISISGFSYSPMKTMKQAVDTLLNTGSSITMNANIGGTNNSYQWFKSGNPTATSDTLILSGISFADEGQYINEVTNSVVAGLTLRSDTFNIRVSSIERDKIALETLYNSTNGAAWTSSTNWLSTDLSTWEGVVVLNNRVTEVNLPGHNLAGIVPVEMADITELTTMDFSSNLISEIPNVTSLSNITTFNVSQNKLEFGSLEPNAKVTGINYANQDSIGVGGLVVVAADADQQLDIVTTGLTNNYQWFKDGTVITDSTNTTVIVPTIRRAEEGAYYVQVTNDSVPGLTLISKTYIIVAQTDISGVITLDGTSPMTSGDVLLLQVTAAQGYDTLSTQTVTADGSYTHSNMKLVDYITIVLPDTLTHKDYLPTYYSNTIFWEEADTIFLDSMMVDFNIMLQGGPAVATTGSGKIVGILEEEVPDGGRIEAKKRVSGAGVSVRRRHKQGRGEEHEYELVDYVYSNENGEFGFYNLDVDEYLINIQYPGYPMDTTSNINITVGTDRESDVEIAALVDQGKISVTIIEITGTERAKHYESVEIYPNPTVEKVYLRGLPQGKNYTAFVIDASGKVVITSTTIDNGINVRALNNGLYILKIHEEGKAEAIISSRLMVRDK